MRKYVVGILVGFCLSFVVGAHAEVMNMIGKVVQGEVGLTINNQKMEYQAVLIDGTTYAPVRMLGEATGYMVRFDDATGVKLIKKITTPRETVLKSIEVLNGAITRNDKSIKEQKEELNKLRNESENPTIVDNIRSIESNIERLTKDTSGCQEQIAKLNQTLSDIDAQQAELNQP